MGTLYQNIIALCQHKGIKPGRMCADANISKGLITDLKMGRKKSITIETAKKIADYFEVPVDAVTGDSFDLDAMLIIKTVDEDLSASRKLIDAANEKSPVGTKADEANVDYLLSKMSLSELAELAVKVATEMKERGLE